MRILVVEPHPDDAFFSLGWHIKKLWAEHEVTILTVYSNSKRAAEAQRYAAEVGAVSVVLGLEESNMQSKQAVSICEPLQDAVEDIAYDVAAFPLGLQHPDHKAVAASRPAGALQYIDTPYQTKQKCAVELAARAATGRPLASIVWPSKTKWRQARLYASQGRFLHYNPLHNWKLPEILLAPLGRTEHPRTELEDYAVPSG